MNLISKNVQLRLREMYEDIGEVIIEKLKLSGVQVLETKISTIFLIEIKKENWIKDTIKLLKFLDTIDYEKYNSIYAKWLYADCTDAYEELESGYFNIQSKVVCYQEFQDTNIILDFVR